MKLYIAYTPTTRNSLQVSLYFNLPKLQAKQVAR